MITKKELGSISSIRGLNLGQGEKNYLHIITLFALAKKFPEALVFKGGTALMICHSLPRFSEDLDFTATTNDIEPILEAMRDFLTQQDIETELTLVSKTPVSYKYNVRYKGPLYNGTRQTTAKIELDISLREHIIQETTTSRIIHSYPDIPTFFVQTMSLEEIFAEKIRAIITRNKARDLFDAEFLLAKHVPVHLHLVEQKLRFYDLSFSVQAYHDALETKRSIWKPELQNLMSVVPDFDEVKSKLLKIFKEQ